MPFEYNYRTKAEWDLLPNNEHTQTQQPFDLHGLSCFLRVDDAVHHTYSTYGRGPDAMGFTPNALDLTALGRQEPWEKPAGRTTGLGAKAGDPSTPTARPTTLPLRLVPGVDGQRSAPESARAQGSWGTGRSVSRILSVAIIYLRWPLPGTSSGLPASSGGQPSDARADGGCPSSFLALLHVGFTEPPQSPAELVVSYTTVSPSPALR